MRIDWSRTATGVAHSLDEVPKGARIEAIDDVPCLGLCGGCEKPILEGDSYGHDDEGDLFCRACVMDAAQDDDLKAECGHPSEGA